MNAPNKLALGALAVFFLLSTFVHSQAVSLMPIPEQQFFTATGAVCSGCFVYTYQSGTYTPQASYTDYSGLYANTNPIVLNSGGFPATAAGAQVAIWLTPSVLYRIVVQNAAHVQLYQIDGIGGTAQTFNGPVSILSTSNQLIMGATGFTTTLNFPAPASSITLNFPVTADTLVGRATTDTLTNKTLTSPVINTPTVNSVQLVNSPGTYVTATNATTTGTTLSTLTILQSAPSQAVIAATTTTNGVIGICVSGCGITGSATIQQSGSATCVFDGATTAGDWVQISSTTAGDCHDSGIAPPSVLASSQTIGTVTTTNASAGAYTVIMAAGGNGSRGTLCASGTASTVGNNTTSIQVMSTCAFPSGVLNTVGKTFRVQASIDLNPGGSYTETAFFGMGTTSALGAYNTIGNVGSASTNAWTIASEMLCAVTATGSSGALICSDIGLTSGLVGVPVGGQITFGSINLTGAVYVGTACSFSTASSSNACTTNPFAVEQLN